MQLNFSQIETITAGAVRITQETDGIYFTGFSQYFENLIKSI